MTDLYTLSIHEAARLLRERKISSVELTKAHLDRIRAVEPQVKAYTLVTDDLALKQAEEADRRIASGEDLSPLTGIPIAIKDVICTKDIPTTCGSRMLENFKPPYNATVMEKLNKAGAVMLGKTNMDEFAMGSSTEHSAFFPTHNPWDLERAPGGSSGGSAAAVAAGMAMGAYGTDTGGSIRQPGSLCNVVGLKPTYGRVSRFGLVAFASSLDQIGPFTRNAQDAALMLQAVAGYDAQDATSSPQPVTDYTKELTGNIKGLRIGVPREYWVEGIQPGVEKVVREGIERLRELGAELVDVSLPHTKYGLAAYYIVAPAEASANLARYDGVKYGYSYRETSDMWEAMEKTRQYGFGAEVKRRIMLGTYALSAGYYDAYYKRAEQVRTLIKQDFVNVFKKVDALVSPTCPTVAFKLGEITDPYQMYLQDMFTIPANLAGICGVSIPAGFSEGLPVGLQLLGNDFAEGTILRIADAFQRVTDFHDQWPDLQ
ncbi:aspartyl/glutamyl-tRNA(Asn/Gln) amidotransferase subunit A [Thermosporothrix hazakensis]|jgi:aspartyl-tRNA(Asn)/glutamyl-tRNA(Gln) amidotransferase subunit A|uniref:Glutamyl-tRNA(Gln) amidotransferase subunit A n=2 Tax=Thermosporothrix TaxID=768650 RepID=A0A326TYZ3_THEHA|nr:Asp-tRNA(Asn)/Glu-tRNA(Gln) amidotransferase subunit GatA [Thermosporothrix hazakensis]PZW21009.1 aspartyl/glutamyl-tRNA(Asn/Gln) amidotransferase subunit A [Thermosporothrix hazakensis]BBH91147.1 glutamyl-tRNA(Gln) amidotransferase subunit A [Thermosporothrix sp. COM3]GCE49292.1 glutamyl-tRNA(Gln) amidotransferase subunit A [Thermosporothrix hazakensis]